jgi:predicted nucleic acid-binding protein
MIQEFVVDNSVVMSWCFQDETNKYSDAVLDCLASTSAYVPAIWPLEVGNVLLVAERKNRLSQADSSRFITLLLDLPIIVEQELPERTLGEILALAR